MRVTLVTETYFPQVNGVSRTLGELARCLLDCGDDVQLICPDYGAGVDFEHVHHVPSIVLPFYKELRLPRPPFGRVHRAITAFRPDIVHIATEATLGLSVFNSNPNAEFSFLSGNGADPTGRSRVAFARYKGQAEKALVAAGFPRVYLFRPAYIYPVQPRKEPNFSYRLLRAVYPVFRLLFPNQVIRADELAWAMVDVVLRQTRGRQGLVFENRDIRTMVESPHPSPGWCGG